MSTNNYELLRQHVDHLLSSYVQTYLVKDHIEYTNNIFQLLKPYFLHEVPLADPTAFTLPVDPLDNLFKLISIDEVPRYEERFKANQEATQLIKQHLRTRPGAPKTERVVEEDECTLVEPPEQIWPALTRKRVRLGPFARRRPASTSIHESCGKLMQNAAILPTSVEAVQEPDVPLEQTLKVTWAFTKEEREEVRNLLKHVTDMRRPQPDHKNSVLHVYLHEDALFPDLTEWEEEFTPLFPRNRQAGYGKQEKIVEDPDLKLKDLANIIPQAIVGSDDADMSFSEANLEVVDGWSTFKVSSPASILTPTSSQEDSKIDQLFLEDSPITDPTIGYTDEIIEEYHMPRSRCIGGSYYKRPHELHGKSIGTFLPSIIRREKMNEMEPMEDLRSSPTLDSLGGQASITAPGQIGLIDDDEELNKDIARLCPDENMTDVIMKVKIENDDFMEGQAPCFRDGLKLHELIATSVPSLCSPNVYTSVSLKLPTRLSDLTRDTEGQSDLHPLKKAVKGISALRVSLSWVAFTTDAPLPSHEEICQVSALFPSSTEGVEEMLRWALSDGLKDRDPLSDFLHEDIDLALIPENDTAPLILIARKSLQSKRSNLPSVSSSPGHKRSIIDDSPLFPGIDASITSKRPRIAPNVETEEFLYEPSILHFREPTNSFTFFDTNCVELSPIDIPFLDQETVQIDPTSAANVKTIQTDEPFLSIAIPREEVMDGSILRDLSATADLTLIEDSNLCADSNISHLKSFAKLRAKVLSQPVDNPIEPSSSSSPSTEASHQDNSTAIINDRSTLFPPDDDYSSGRPHRYMVSMEFVQRQAIVREIRRRDIDLVERTSLGGVELIVDPFSAVIVSSLFTLPAYGKLLASRISEHSWRFQHILVVLEGYPEVLSFKPPKLKSDGPELSAYTPPIVKAIKKLRRDVTIAEACGKKNPGCEVRFSFAGDTSEAGKIIRYYGNLAEERDPTGGILWQPREWLEEEELPDEEDLSKLDGMNTMSATILLCKASADEIIAMLPEERQENFGHLIGMDAVNSLNNDLVNRFGAIDTSETWQSSDNEEMLLGR
ncbi:hypothetical protein NP233_g9608 [Leucocoprinus birnbaumii]|uniref:Uncharacterized protein n=1 Tax=Leucocoprinus birnbaumii TaxID=56174 RepID=A0AAD5YSP3_9AGAR|nr:hypothetical protein NP233_g9608 [Leucocoprinus birnbaumii]